MNLFKRKLYIPIKINNKNLNEPKIPDGMWTKCSHCLKTTYMKSLDSFKICKNCKGYFRLTARERIEITADQESFIEINSEMTSKNPLNYPGYDEKINKLKESTRLNEAVLTGYCTMGNIPIMLAVMDSNFFMGSMGSVVGEKLTRAFELATDKQLPIIIFTASGGARMQEGIISLMQMAKVSSAVARHSSNNLLYITVLTDPTMGGVTASFAMISDIILAEPKTLIGFAGRRVIEQVTKEKLPSDFQTSEYLLEQGFLDKIVKREHLRQTLIKILEIHYKS